LQLSSWSWACRLWQWPMLPSCFVVAEAADVPGAALRRLSLYKSSTSCSLKQCDCPKEVLNLKVLHSSLNLLETELAYHVRSHMTLKGLYIRGPLRFLNHSFNQSIASFCSPCFPEIDIYNRRCSVGYQSWWRSTIWSRIYSLISGTGD